MSFKPKEDDPLFALLGKEVDYTMIGFAADDRGQAAAIAGPAGLVGLNEVPHITISCAEGTKPVYSNELLREPMVREMLRGVPAIGTTLRAVVKAVVKRGKGIEHLTSLEG